MDATQTNLNVRFEPDEKPTTLLSAGLGIQFAMLVIGGIVLTPAIVIRAADGSETFLLWAVFAALIVSGVTTILQAVRIGRVGAGYILIMGTSGAFIAVCVTAIADGGPGMLATLVIISSLFQFGLATRLSRFRRIITPTIAGTVIMLIPVTVMPIIFDLLPDVAEGVPAAAAPVTAAVALVVILAISFSNMAKLRLWGPVIGIVAGCIVGGYFGIYDTQRVIDADWFGFPDLGWPGFDLEFGPVFWSLLPAFVFVTLVGAIETVGDSIAVQGVSWRSRRAVNYREVQGAVTADGVGNLLSGMMGTVPNTTYSTSIALVELTGVAARKVGVCIGITFIVLAICPKVTAAILAIPNPVVAVFTLLLLAMLFTVGMRIIVQDGLNSRKIIVVGVSFWVGVGFQSGVIFGELLNPWWAGFLGNGMTAGGITAILLTLFGDWMGLRSRRIETELSADKVPEIHHFLDAFAGIMGWDEKQTTRLCSAGEEALLTLIEIGESNQSEETRRLLLKARKDGENVEMEFIAAGQGVNLEDRMALLGDVKDATAIEYQISLRLLRHFVSSVRHQQYHDADILVVRVNGPSLSNPP